MNNLTKRKRKLRQCKGCKELVKKVSRKGYCSDCSVQRATNSILQLQHKEGEFYEIWKTNIVEGIKKKEQKPK